MTQRAPLPRRRFGLALLVTIVALVPFLRLASIQYDGNALNEVLKADAGGRFLTSPNHLLYRPTAAWLADRFVDSDDPRLRLRAFQVVTACGAAVAIGLGFLSFLALSGSVAASAVATAFLASSHAFWLFSVDAFYITPAAMFLTAALAVTTGRMAGSLAAASLACIPAALAVLTWQASLFALPGLALLTAAADPAAPVRRRIARASFFLVGTATATAVPLAVVGWLHAGCRSTADFGRWLTSYSGGRLPHWGVWSVERLPAAAWSAVRSVVPLSDNSSQGSTWSGLAGRSSTLVWLALVALALLVVVGCVALLRNRGAAPLPGAVPGLTVGYVGFVPFIVWWDPWEIKWFVLANVFLAGLLAVALGAAPRPRRTAFVASCCVAVTAASVFWLRILPMHTVESGASQRARCLAERSSDRDLLLATDWSWCGELALLYRRDVLHIVDLTAHGHHGEQALSILATRIAAVKARGGQTYMIDLDRVPTPYLARLGRQTGISAEDWERLQTEPAFTCGGVEFVTVAAVRPANRQSLLDGGTPAPKVSG